MKENTILSIALVHNWPGARNSELDIILRIVAVLKKMGHSASIIDPMGHVLTEQGERVEPLIIGQTSYDLIINLHYLNPKYLDGLSYVVNWNPLAYIVDDPITKRPFPLKQFNYIADCMRSHDRLLSAGSVLVDGYADAVRSNHNRDFLQPKNLTLHTTIESVEETGVNETLDADSFRVFYIGVNWEKLSQDKARSIRHEGLFERLDQSKRFAFYGLREQNGVLLWEGINSYCGELPFDGGKSIIEKSREHGVTLVLSSEQHRESALVSTRIFQACAAGAVIISDKNAFVEKHFGDSVYYFDYGDEPVDTANNILTVVDNIRQNWPIALSKAKLSNQIYREKFTLEDEINNICLQVEDDIARKKAEILRLSHTGITVLFKYKGDSLTDLTLCLENLARQTHKNVTLHILMTGDAKHSILDVDALVQAYSICTTITSWHGTLGLYIAKYYEGFNPYWMVYSAGFYWSCDHLFELLHTNKQQNLLTYSPLFIEYANLKQTNETMDFFIKGLDGGFARLTERELKRFDNIQYANGNMLLETHGVFANRAIVKQLPLFDLACPFLCAYELYTQLGVVPKLVANITSRFVTEAHYGHYVYNQYVEDKSEDSLYRDRNAFCVLYRDTNSALQEQVHSWELEQADGNVIYGYDLENRMLEVRKEFGKMRQELVQGEYSASFSLLVYFRHLFRRRPLLLKIINAAHVFFTRRLKI